MLRRVITIRATDSPNVQLSLKEIAEGKPPSHTIVIPGVLTYQEYLKRRQTWDIVRQTVGLDAEFYEGAQLLLFPPDRLNRAHEIHLDLVRKYGSRRTGKSIGIDPAEGGDSSAMAAVDDKGLIELVSKKTPDTNIVCGETIAFGKKHGVPASKWMFDAGGGGKQHADRLRAQGYSVQIVRFGEPIILQPKRSKRLFQERVENREERFSYINRRTEMYGIFSLLLDPVNEGWGIPDGDGTEDCPYMKLRKQLAVFPRLYDDIGRMFLPPKHPKPGVSKSDPKRQKSLVELIGHSPDEADAVVLAIYGMCQKKIQTVAGAV